MSLNEFQYIINKQNPASISFLSGKNRWNYNNKKVSPTFYITDINSISYRLEHKIGSNKGFGALAKSSPRFQREPFIEKPPPNKYNLSDKKIVRKAKYPFNAKLPRFPAKVFDKKNIPGPGSYDPKLNAKLSLPKQHAFGGKMKIIEPIEIICLPGTRDICEICENICEDCYWHYDFTSYLCRDCMRNERRLQRKYKKQELKNFKRIRECSFMHKHEGTTAAVRLITKNEFIIKKRLENYIDLYLSNH